jgi:myo-inositol catabolism protein IolC
MLGYPHKLYILPFDHRSSFIKSFFGDLEILDKKSFKLICEYKETVFEGFLLAKKELKRENSLAILVDPYFGEKVIKEALKKSITVCLPVEKSGSKIFGFEHGDKFGEEILKFNAPIVKALVRYNPANIQGNLIQLKRLKKLSDFCRDKDFKLMLELLIPPTALDLKRVGRNFEAYDKKIRPRLTLKTVREFHAAGVEPDIWKIEALEKDSDWPEIIAEIRAGKERKNVAIILLGRGESFAKVKNWFDAAPKYELNGFAVGRTVFLRPLIDLHNKQISRKETIKEIAKNYLELIAYWEK